MRNETPDGGKGPDGALPLFIVYTFVMIVINNYAAALEAGAPQFRQVTQFIYELNISLGTTVEAQMRVRTAMVPEGGKMSGNWKTIQTA